MYLAIHTQAAADELMNKHFLMLNNKQTNKRIINVFVRPLELTDLPNIVVLISFNKYFFSPGSCTDYVQLGEPETEIHKL